MTTQKKPELYGGNFTFTQDADSCSDAGTQELGVSVEDAGGGKYLVIKTDRWAIDSVADLTAMLERIVALWGEEWGA